jgi:hypothetical protein
MDPASRSSREPPGFRLVRQLGADVWQAEQLGLNRTVALRRLPGDASFRATQWPDRPGVVDLFAVVPGADGTYVATRFLPGARTLAECRGTRVARQRRWLAEAAAALDGAVHGRLTERDILVDADGHAQVTGFGLAPPEATAEDDRAALERMQPERRRRSLLLPAAGLAAAGTVAVVALSGGGPAPAPPLPAGTRAFGSTLAPGKISTLDCEGGRVSANSLPCTVLQTDLAGRPLVAPSAGLVRGWAVRGASGRMRLQIVVRRGGGYVAYNRSRPVTVAPGAPRYFRADRSFPAGASFALEVFPGAAVGIRRGADGATARFFSPLRATVRSADRVGGERQELLLRVDVVSSR